MALEFALVLVGILVGLQAHPAAILLGPAALTLLYALVAPMALAGRPILAAYVHTCAALSAALAVLVIIVFLGVFLPYILLPGPSAID